jgi:epoxyqueuosine reductase
VNNLLRQDIEDIARDLNIDIIGFSSVDDIDLYKKDYLNRIKKKLENNNLYPRNRMDYLDYMNVDMVLDNARTIISIGVNYNQERLEVPNNAVTYSKASFGLDYHIYLERLINQLLSKLENITSFNYYFQIDTKILDDRFFAFLCGNGFYGKNSMIINPKFGSMCFYATIVIDKEVVGIDTNRFACQCGACNLCERVCPNKSLKDYQLSYKTCLSYLTQSKTLVSPFKMGNVIYGCDICNDICPFNKEHTKHDIFLDRQFYLLDDVINLDNYGYEEEFGSKALSWLNKNILRKNIVLSQASFNRDLQTIVQSRNELLKDKNISKLLIEAYDKLIKLKSI